MSPASIKRDGNHQSEIKLGRPQAREKVLGTRLFCARHLSLQTGIPCACPTTTPVSSLKPIQLLPPLPPPPLALKPNSKDACPQRLFRHFGEPCNQSFYFTCKRNFKCTLDVLHTFTGVLQKKIRTRAVFKEIPQTIYRSSCYISIERL